MDIKCFDATKSLIEEFGTMLKDGYEIDNESVRKFEGFCGQIDLLRNEWESEYLDVEVVMSGNINVTIEAFETEVDKESGVFPAVLGMCESVFITAADDNTGKTRVCFIFPSIAKKEDE